MTDSNLLLKYLLEQTLAVTALATDICFPGLPEGFDPKAGDRAVVFSVRGGTPDPFAPILRPSMQVRTWARTAPEARELYRAVFEALHAKSNLDLGAAGYLMSSWCESEGQDLTDEGTAWETVLSFFKLNLRSSTNISPGPFPVPLGRRHYPLEATDGVRVSFTFPGLPANLEDAVLVLNGLINTQYSSRVGDVLTLDAPPEAPPFGEFYAFY